MSARIVMWMMQLVFSRGRGDSGRLGVWGWEGGCGGRGFLGF